MTTFVRQTFVPAATKAAAAEEKRKLLWAHKKTETTTSASAWSDSHFDDPQRKEKFLQLMGAKKSGNVATSNPPAAPGAAPASQATAQTQLFEELEREYMIGLSHGGGKGLGFRTYTDP
jgi:hypothetical protein